MTNPDDDRIHAEPLTITGMTLPHGSIQSTKIADGAIETGDVVEDLRRGDPKTVEAFIIAVLSRATVNGITDLGKDEARRLLGIYRQHVIEQSQQ